MIDTITVVFKEELQLLKIQARSFELYIDPDKIKNIYVVVNDEVDVLSLIDTAWWGVNAHKVRLIHRLEHGNFYYLDGWSSQQIHKLCAARGAESEWSMCFDAKTWLAQPLVWDKLFDGDRPRLNAIDTIPAFIKARVFVENLFNVTLDQTIGPAGVPFMFHTATVVEMCDIIQETKGVGFGEYMSYHMYDPDRVTEFVLYSGFVKFKYGGFDALYSESQVYSISNLDHFELDRFSEIFSCMFRSLTIGMHRRVYPKLTEQQRNEWLSLLQSRNLITGPQDLSDFY